MPRRVRIGNKADFISGKSRYLAGQEYAIEDDDLVLPSDTVVLEVIEPEVATNAVAEGEVE